MSGEILIALGAVAGVAVLLRLLGYFAAPELDETGFFGRLLHHAPGNLFVAFTVVGMVTGGYAVAAGCAATLTAAWIWRNDFLSLASGTGAVFLAAWLIG